MEDRNSRITLVIVLGLLCAIALPQVALCFNLGTLKTEARALALDSGSTRQRHSDARITAYLNEGQRIAVLDAKPIFRSEQFELVAGTTYYSLPADFLQMYRVTLDYDILDETTPEALDRTDRWQETGAKPTHYVIFFASRTKVAFYPFPDSSSSTGTVRYEYAAQATDMAADSDSPFGGVTELVPYQYILAQYAAARMAVMDGRADFASLYLAEFSAGVARMARESKLRPSYRPSASGRTQ